MKKDKQYRNRNQRDKSDFDPFESKRRKYLTQYKRKQKYKNYQDLDY